MRRLHPFSPASWACVLLLAARSTLAATDAEQQAVLATVQTLLDGWREADAGKLETVLHPDFREVTFHLIEGKWDFATVDRARLISLMSKIDKGAWDDRLIDPVVHVDGPIAVVWSRYEFTVHYVEDGVEQAPKHCGIETFQLYRVETEWKIVNFADTHSDACP
jgi:hypothetical protein